MLLRIRQERIKRQWTLEYVAHKIGVKTSCIQKIETGRRKPSYEVLIKLLNLFGYENPQQLFAVADENSEAE